MVLRYSPLVFDNDIGNCKQLPKTFLKMHFFQVFNQFRALREVNLEMLKTGEFIVYLYLLTKILIYCSQISQQLQLRTTYECSAQYRDTTTLRKP